MAAIKRRKMAAEHRSYRTYSQFNIKLPPWTDRIEWFNKPRHERTGKTLKRIESKDGKGNFFPPRCCVSFSTEEEEIKESNLKVPLMDAGLKNSGLEKLASKRNYFEIYGSKWITMLNDVPTRLIKKNWAFLPLSLSLFFLLEKTRAYYQDTTSVERKTETIYSFFYIYVCIFLNVSLHRLRIRDSNGELL